MRGTSDSDVNGKLLKFKVRATASDVGKTLSTGISSPERTKAPSGGFISRLGERVNRPPKRFEAEQSVS